MTQRGARPPTWSAGTVATRITVGAGALLLAVGCAGASDNADTVPAPDGAEQTSLNPRGPDAQKIQDLFTPFFWIGVLIGVLVVGAVIFAAIRFRARSDDERPRQVHGSTGLEVGWTIAPALILLVMGVPTVGLIFELAEKPEGDIVEITVTGKQWWWQYEYPEDGFYTANEMYIPVGKPVYLSLESDNVLHSFWIPNLAGKKDLVPGRTHNLTIEASEPGTYLGQCAEYCGLSHANMRLRVIAVPEDEYDAWVAGQQAALSAEEQEFIERPADEGGVIAKYGCTQCHSFAPDTDAGIGPNLANLATRESFAGAMFELDEENLRSWVRDAPSMKPMQTGDQPGAAPATPTQVPGMPPFPEMTDDEVDELVDFLLGLE